MKKYILASVIILGLIIVSQANAEAQRSDQPIRETAKFICGSTSIYRLLDDGYDEEISISNAKSDYILTVSISSIDGPMIICEDFECRCCRREILFFFLELDKKDMWRVMVKTGDTLDEYVCKKELLPHNDSFKDY